MRSRGRTSSDATPTVLTGTLRRYQQVAELLCNHGSASNSAGDDGGGGGSDGGGGNSSGNGSGSGSGDGSGGASDGGSDDGFWARSTRVELRALNELCFGSLEGLPGGKLRNSFPAEYEARARDPLHYRYPGVGSDSYLDLVTGCREVVLTLERTRSDVAVVCDVAIARVLIGYFTGSPLERIPDVEVTPGLFELARGHSGFSLTRHRVDVGRPSLLAA